jgi:serine/threonine protein kinase
MDCTHADIKPENILISSNGDICLTDFGLSVFSDDYHPLITGTRQYSGPEIILGNVLLLKYF